MSEEQAEHAVIEITSIDLKPEFRGSALRGKDKSGIERIFIFRPDTKIRRISPVESTQQLGEILAVQSSLPFRVGQEVLVAWKVDPQSSQKIAVKITVFE